MLQTKGGHLQNALVKHPSEIDQISVKFVIVLH